VPCQPGVVVPASVPHGVKAIERFKMLLVMIREPAPDAGGVPSAL
jgi:quercetin dioxygenase-like cupin family protein